MQKKVVLIGGPGTGKSTVLNELEKRNYLCMHEISREVTLEAQKKGIDQLFLTEPLLFSKLLFEGREQQYVQAHNSDADIVFFDRGMPDVYAYMDYSNEDYPDDFKAKSKELQYDAIFLFKPWRKIYISDNERYETFEQSKAIDKFLQNAYLDLGYKIINVPFGSVQERTDFILHSLRQNT